MSDSISNSDESAVHYGALWTTHIDRIKPPRKSFMENSFLVIRFTFKEFLYIVAAVAGFFLGSFLLLLILRSTPLIGLPFVAIWNFFGSFLCILLLAAMSCQLGYRFGIKIANYSPLAQKMGESFTRWAVMEGQRKLQFGDVHVRNRRGVQEMATCRIWLGTMAYTRGPRLTEEMIENDEGFRRVYVTSSATPTVQNGLFTTEP